MQHSKRTSGSLGCTQSFGTNGGQQDSPSVKSFPFARQAQKHDFSEKCINLELLDYNNTNTDLTKYHVSKTLYRESL